MMIVSIIAKYLLLSFIISLIAAVVKVVREEKKIRKEEEKVARAIIESINKEDSSYDLMERNLKKLTDLRDRLSRESN